MVRAWLMLLLTISLASGRIAPAEAQNLPPRKPGTSIAAPQTNVPPPTTPPGTAPTTPTDAACLRNPTLPGCDPGGSAGGDPGGTGIFLPPLLADLLDGLTGGGTVTLPGDPGPRPPRVTDGGGTATPPPRPTPPTTPVPLPSFGPLIPIPVAQPAPPRIVVPNLPPRAVSGAAVVDEVLVTIDGNAATAAAIAAANNLDVRELRVSTLLGATLARLGIPDGRSVGQVLAQIDADGRAGAAEPNHIFALQQSGQQSGGLPQYAFERISLGIGEASGADIAIAVIDSGVDAGHPDLGGVVVAHHDALPDLPEEDRKHGTAIVGLIAAQGGARGGVRGVAPGAVIHHSRAFEGGRSTMNAILASLDWAAGEEVRIINMSFAGPRNDLMQRAIEAARRAGIVLVAAAGNGGPKAPHAFPAAFDDVIAVTATDDADRLMPEANRGAYVFISAPGVDVAAPVPGGTDFLTGTSMASAILAGAVANLLRINPDLGPAEIEAALRTSAVDLGPPGRDRDFGYGRIDTAAALIDAKAL